MIEKSRRLRKGTPDDWPSLALLEFTMALSRAMADNDMKQKDLAEALEVSSPYISSVMAGNENLTVEQMSRLAEAAGGSLHLTIAPKGQYIKWVEDTLEVPAMDSDKPLISIAERKAKVAGRAVSSPSRRKGSKQGEASRA